jgi:cobalamin biosynthesis protein CobT
VEKIESILLNELEDHLKHQNETLKKAHTETEELTRNRTFLTKTLKNAQNAIGNLIIKIFCLYGAQFSAFPPRAIEASIGVF